MKLELSYIPDSELEKLPVVTSKNVVERNRFHREGLFSEQIFGPVKDYKCWCKDTPAAYGQVCPTCGIKIASSSLRRTTFATIKVERLINPVAIEILTFSNKRLVTIINKILNMKIAYYNDPDNKRVGFVPLNAMTHTPDVKQTADIFKCDVTEIDDRKFIYGLDAIFELACIACDTNIKHGNKSLILNKLHSMIVNNDFFTKYIVVIPPDLRPAMIDKNGNKNVSMDTLNKLYLTVLLMTDTDMNISGTMKHILECKIQQTANQINKFVFENIGKKSGMMRNKMSGKRIDFSGRGVITVDPEIPLGKIKVSRLILLQLWKLEIARVLMNRGEFVTFKMAFDKLQEYYEQYYIPDYIKEIIDDVASDKFIIFNRQPTLHRGGLFSSKIIPIDEYVISINPLICDPLNADFDGDTIALYRPLTTKAIEECEEKLWTLETSNIFSAANGEVQFKPKQGIVYGNYLLTSTKKGRDVFNKLIKCDIGDEKITSKKLMKVVTDKVKSGDIEVLDKIKNIGFSYIMNNSETMSILDLEPIKVEITGDKDHDSKELDNVTNEIKNSFSKKDIIDSGARASWDQVRQMVAARGYVSDFYGNIVPVPIKDAYANGLSGYDYFTSCYGARKGILDVAENTAKSGFLTRKMVYAATTSELDINNDDCGTKNCIRLNVNNEDLAKSIIGRYYYDIDDSDGKLKCVSDVNDVLNKEILLRSPIFCKGDKICKTCYGKLADVHKSRYIGIIAAQSIGERSTQLVLRTFHTGGVAHSKNLKEQHDIISTIHTVDTLDKNIDIPVYQDVVDYTVGLFNLFKEYGNINLVHFEIITSQRLWAELDNKYVRVRTNQELLSEYEEYDNYGNIVNMNYKLKLLALKSIPSMESWFLGMTFQSARSNFIKGFIHPTNKVNVMEKIVLGQL